jgi:magnesium chelatase family protein
MFCQNPPLSFANGVIKGRRLQSLRFKDLPHIYCNAQMPDSLIESFCVVEPAARKHLLKMMDLLQLSVRSYTRILKVARTIADLAGSADIEINHVAEALHFRNLDKPLTLPYKQINKKPANQFPRDIFTTSLK